MELNNHLIAGQ